MCPRVQERAVEEDIWEDVVYKNVIFHVSNK